MTKIEDEARAAANGGGAHAAPQPQYELVNGIPTGNLVQPAHLSRWGRIHADVTGFGRALLEMGKVTGRIVADPKLEEGVELLMTAAGLGAQARDVELVLVQLRHIVAELQAQGSGPQAFLPAPDGHEAM